MKKKYLLTMCLSILFISGFINRSIYAEKKEIKSNWIDQEIEKNMKSASVVGLSAAITIGKEKVWSKGYGFSNLKGKKKFTADTLINIASISKTIVGACIMHAVDNGLLELDKDINNYLPFKIHGPKITLKHLFTHTSGIVDDIEGVYTPSFRYGNREVESLKSFLKNYLLKGGKHYKKSNFSGKDPGLEFNYSNIGAGLAGLAIENVSGMKFSQYCIKNIFKPLGMKDSGWFLKEIDKSKHSRVYNMTKKGLKLIDWYYWPTYPDGGVRTSANELAKFLCYIASEGKNTSSRILKNETLKYLVKPKYKMNNLPANSRKGVVNYGVFFQFRKSSKGGFSIGHNGMDPGVFTMMYYNSMSKIGMIFLINTHVLRENTKYLGQIYKSLWKLGRELKGESE